MKILLLEDDGEIGAWVSDGLARSGHAVDWLKDGKEALVAATTREYDVLVWTAWYRDWTACRCSRR